MKEKMKKILNWINRNRIILIISLVLLSIGLFCWFQIWSQTNEEKIYSFCTKNHSYREATQCMIEHGMLSPLDEKTRDELKKNYGWEIQY